MTAIFVRGVGAVTANFARRVAGVTAIFVRGVDGVTAKFVRRVAGVTARSVCGADGVTAKIVRGADGTPDKTVRYCWVQILLNAIAELRCVGWSCCVWRYNHAADINTECQIYTCAKFERGGVAPRLVPKSDVEVAGQLNHNRT